MARVLVVEPERRICRFIAGILTEFGHDVEQCDNARGARRWLRRARFDVLVTDLVVAEDNIDDFAALARGLPVVTLRGQRFGADNGERLVRLYQTPFRFADLAVLVAAVEMSGADLRWAARAGRHAHPAAGGGEGIRQRPAAVPA